MIASGVPHENHQWSTCDLKISNVAISIPQDPHETMNINELELGILGGFPMLSLFSKAVARRNENWTGDGDDDNDGGDDLR